MPAIDPAIDVVRRALQGAPLGPLPRSQVLLHGLVPVLAPAEVGGDDAEWLEAAHREHVVRALAGAASTARVHRVLADAGVRALALKGATLGLRTTGRVDGRAFSDADVLVDPASIPAAGEALQASGWRPAGPTSHPYGGPHPRWAGVVGHHVHYDHPAEIDVELHWQATNAWSFPVGFEDLWGRRRAFVVGGSELKGLGDVDELLQVATHAAMHRFIRLAWIVDVVRLLPPVRDRWEEVIVRAGRLGVSRPVAVALQLARALDDHGLDVPLSPRERRLTCDLAARAWARMPVTAADLGDAQRWSRVRSRLQLRPDLGYKGRTLAEALVPLDRLEATGLPTGRAFLAVAWEGLAVGHAQARG